MSAALQTPPPLDVDPSSERDGWSLLDGIRRRLDEQGSQARKTQQQVTQLTESIAALVETQRRRTRGINLNSFVAYLIFTLLCGAAFYALYLSRTGDLDAARDQETARADELSAKLAAREAAETRAWEIWQLLERGKRGEAGAQLAAARDLSRTERALLAARLTDVRVPTDGREGKEAREVKEPKDNRPPDIDAALKAATASFRAGRYTEVIAPLEAVLPTEPTGKRAAAMRYFLGIAYSKTGPLEKAVAYMQEAVDGGVDHADARFQLASVLDRSGAGVRARAEYERFVAQYPQSQFAQYARNRAVALGAPAAPAAAGSGSGSGSGS